jgi:hypothetical protein
MKSIYKIFLLALGVYSSAFSQITEITRLPVQDISQSIFESVPIWLSSNEILIFYLNETRDTIFSTKSKDGGISWSQPKVIAEVNITAYQSSSYLSGLKSSTGRVFLAWTIFDESMKLIYSDDNGENWSDPINIPGGGGIPALQKKSSLLNLTEWDDGKLCLSFLSQGEDISYFKLSSDMGMSWSEEAYQFPGETGFEIWGLTIISIDENKLFAVFERHENSFRTGIYSRVSTDYGINWGEFRVIADEIHHEQIPEVTKLADGKIIVLYHSDNIRFEYEHDQNDVYYKYSQDNGSSWSEENQFTRYAGEDFNINLSSLQNSTFISFTTERYSTNVSGKTTYQIVYGILEESLDLFTPPKIYSTSAPLELIDENKNTFVFRAKVYDDEAVSKVFAVMEDSIFIGEMFDDGLHNDGEANDSVYGNTFPIIYPRYLNGYRMDVNKLNLPFDNKGILADVNIYFGQKAVVLADDIHQNQSLYYKEVQIGAGASGVYDGGSFLFSAGFFLSGYANGSLFANGVASGALVEDYLPGKVGSLPNNPLNVMYVVNKNDPPFGISWQKWRDAVSLGAEFYDGDRDGIYNPVDKNWNRTLDPDEDMPLLIGDETAWCVFNDGLPSFVRRWQSEPQGIEIRQTLFATNDTNLENVIFIRYSILNTGDVAEVMDSVYFGVWEDADVGDATDDVVGCDTLLQSGFCYANAPDWVYGDNPPSFFTSLLQRPIIETNQNSDTATINYGQIIGTERFAGKKNIDISSHVFMIGGDPTLNDPGSISNARNYLEGKMKTGAYPEPCNWLYSEVHGEVDCNQVNPVFWVSGDPVNNVGWISTQNRDVRNLVSVGPFELEKDKPQEIIIAYVIGRGTDYFNSITVARENVQRAIQEYQSNFASMTYTAPPPEPINNYILHQNFPNPFNPTTTIRYELPQNGVVTIEVFDILGQKVRTILNEFKRSGRYEVTFSSSGLASGVYIYQLRVNDFITSKKMVLLK